MAGTKATAKPTSKAPKRSTKAVQAKVSNDREAMFLEHYLNDPDRNATRAAIKAGYSKANAASQASRMLRRANIAQVVAKAEAKVVAHLEHAVEEFVITKETIARELAKIAFADVPKDKIKASDKRAANMDLAKLYGHVVDKHEQDVPALDAMVELIRSLTQRSALPVGQQRSLPAPNPKE